MDRIATLVGIVGAAGLFHLPFEASLLARLPFGG